MDLLDIVDDFKRKKILVVGDVMLDLFIWGGESRMSPEAPVQIVDVLSETFVPGGAANVAANIVALGGEAYLIGVVGRDVGGDRLRTALLDHGLDASRLVVDSERETTVKTRIFTKDHPLLRYDREKRNHISDPVREEIVRLIEKDIDGVDAVVVSDYAKGVISPLLMKELIALCVARGKKIVVDPKPVNTDLYRGVTLITPNHREARAMRGLSEGSGDETEAEEDGNHLMDVLECSVLITRGKNGMSVFERGSTAKHMPAFAKEVLDITGAGDTVIAAAVLALVSGASLEEAALLANYAAGITVGKRGTSTVSPEELRASL